MRRGRAIPGLVLLAFCGLALRPAHSEQKRPTTRDQEILQIQQLIASRDLMAAHGLLAEAGRRHPGDAGFDNLRGIVEAQEGNYVGAENSFRQAVGREPKFTAAYLNLGRLYQENPGPDPQAAQKAQDVYKRVLDYDPNNSEANYQISLLLLRAGKYRDSLARALHLPSEVRSRAQALSVISADYAALGERKETDNAVARLLADADFSEVDAQQILPGLRVGRRDDLIVSSLETLQRRQPLAPEMLYSLGLAYEQANRLADSRAVLEKYVSGGNLSVASLLELTRVAYKQGDYQSSLGYLAHARDLAPDNARIHYSFGLVCLDMDLLAEARNSFEKAVKLEPENPSYNYAMAAASAFRHDPAEAVPYFEKYIKLRPQDPRGKLGLAVALFRAKDYDTAIPQLREAAKAPETATTAHYYLGAIAVQERRLDEARDQLEQALKGNPDYTNALAELGQYYLITKDYPDAEKQIRRALQTDPDHFLANFYLLNLYTRTGDSRRQTQANRFEELQKRQDEKTQELLRMVEVRPFATP
jgi:Flp pilus assembly protein TadD